MMELMERLRDEDEQPSRAMAYHRTKTSGSTVAMVKWVRRIVLALVVGFVVLYGGDWAVYKMRGSPLGAVSVSRTLVVPLKGNKSEYDYLGTSDVPCSVSLFSQDGRSPCWQLRRNRTQNTNL